MWYNRLKLYIMDKLMRTDEVGVFNCGTAETVTSSCVLSRLLNFEEQLEIILG